MDNYIGQQFGNYQLTRRLGRGGFAEVYLAEHMHLKTLAAVKVLSIQLSAEHVEYFRAEAQMVAQLAHPHIVRVLDFGVEKATPYFVMEYAPGGTLRQLHPRGSRLPLSLILTYVKQIAEALHYIHERKFIHRDIKPENLLVKTDQQILLSDFGIALVSQSAYYPNAQQVVGTVAYMAPEQLQGRPQRASDQYALGIIVYEWLCGDRPFHGSFIEMYSQHLQVSPPSLCAQLPELSPLVEQVVFKALAKDPQQRFVNVQAFANALEQASSVILAPSDPPMPSRKSTQPLVAAIQSVSLDHMLPLENTPQSDLASGLPEEIAHPTDASSLSISELVSNVSHPLQVRHTQRMGHAGQEALLITAQAGLANKATTRGFVFKVLATVALIAIVLIATVVIRTLQIMPGLVQHTPPHTTSLTPHSTHTPSPTSHAKAAGIVTEFPLPTPSSTMPEAIAAGPDGNLWFTYSNAPIIGRITPSGTITEFPITSGNIPGGITAGPDGNLWFTQQENSETDIGKIGRIALNGAITQFPMTTGYSPVEIAAGSDGNLWFIEEILYGNGIGPSKIGRITPTGKITEFPLPTPTNQLYEITAGPDGNLWFTEGSDNGAGPDKIGRITPTGKITEFPITSGSGIYGITAGSDGNLWFTQEGSDTADPGKVGRITPAGKITDFSLSSGKVPTAITSGPDGNLWFIEGSNNGYGDEIGRITPTGTITEFPLLSGSSIHGITAGSDKNLWFTEDYSDKIGRITSGQ